MSNTNHETPRGGNTETPKGMKRVFQICAVIAGTQHPVSEHVESFETAYYAALMLQRQRDPLANEILFQVKPCLVWLN